MQVNKQLITILILASLLFSAIGAALYFFNKNKEVIKKNNELVTIYIAKDDIKKNTLLQGKHLAQTKIAKQFILNKPLIQKEIIGKYTKENIYKHEIFLKQKLNTKIQKAKAKILPFEKSSYNIKFGLFQNPNYSLLQGDIIKIISVFPKGKPNKKGKYLNFDVQYVAKNIKVLGFLRDGRTEADTITKQKVKKIVKKKLVEEIVDVKSDELIIDIESKVLINLIKDYNKGNQLWMVKTKWAKENELKKLEEKHLLLTNKTIKKIQKKKAKKRVYPYSWYIPKNKIIRKTAVIDYANDIKKEKSKTKNVAILINAQKVCSKVKDKFIVGLIENFHIRSEPSTKSKDRWVLHKNIIVPYVKEVNDWYQTCDNKYIHKNVVKKISYKDAIKRAKR